MDKEAITIQRCFRSFYFEKYFKEVCKGDPHAPIYNSFYKLAKQKMGV